MCVTSDLEGKHCGYGRVGVENGAAEAGFRSAVSVCSRSVCLFFLLRNVDDASVSRCPASFFSVFFFLLCLQTSRLAACSVKQQLCYKYLNRIRGSAGSWLSGFTYCPGDTRTSTLWPLCSSCRRTDLVDLIFTALWDTSTTVFLSCGRISLTLRSLCAFGLSSYGRLLGRHCQSEGGPGHVSGMYLLIEAVSVSRHQIEKWVSTLIVGQLLFCSAVRGCD